MTWDVISVDNEGRARLTVPAVVSPVVETKEHWTTVKHN